MTENNATDTYILNAARLYEQCFLKPMHYKSFYFASFFVLHFFDEQIHDIA